MRGRSNLFYTATEAGFFTFDAHMLAWSFLAGGKNWPIPYDGASDGTF